MNDEPPNFSTAMASESGICGRRGLRTSVNVGCRRRQDAQALLRLGGMEVERREESRDRAAASHELEEQPAAQGSALEFTCYLAGGPACGGGHFHAKHEPESSYVGEEGIARGQCMQAVSQ